MLWGCPGASVGQFADEGAVGFGPEVLLQDIVQLAGQMQLKTTVAAFDSVWSWMWKRDDLA